MPQSPTFRCHTLNLFQLIFIFLLQKIAIIKTFSGRN